MPTLLIVIIAVLLIFAIVLGERARRSRGRK